MADEWVPDDDAIIGRVFRWSVVAIVVAAVVVAAGYLLVRNREPEQRVVAKDLTTLPVADLVATELPQVKFTDVTAESGLSFVHVNGARGDKLLPETMGGGAAFLDYDADGDQDLLLVNSTHWPGEGNVVSNPVHALYRNDGTGRFEDVTDRSGLAESFYGMGVAVGDYDGDEDVDLFLTALGANRMYRNDGGRFKDVTATAGVAGDDDAWSTSAGFFDYDNDGDLDLFVCNYVQWSRRTDIELNFTLNGTDRAYGPPTQYEGSYSYLYRNEGDGRFADVSAAAGLHVDNPLSGRPMGKALAVTFNDVDSDGHLDVLVANDTVQNFLFHNQGDGTFRELGAVSGIGFGSAGNATGAMGIDTAYYRNDEQLGVGIANFANEMTSLFVSQRGGLRFSDEAVGEGIGAASRLFLSFGLFFFDYDLDGRLDFVQANGHLESEIRQVQASQSYRQPAQLFWNAGPEEPSCFVEVPREATGDLSKPIVGRGAAYADVDGDGDLDLLLTQIGGSPILLRNDTTQVNRWVRVQLAGTRSNSDGIGAWVELELQGFTQRRQVMPTRSYLSQVELPVTFGLGSGGRVESLRVVWPDGSLQDVDSVEPGELTRVRQL